MGRTKGKRSKNKPTNSEVEKTKSYKVSKKEKEKGKKRHPKLKKAILIFMVFILLLALIGVGIIAGIFFSDKYKVSKEESEIKKTDALFRSWFDRCYYHHCFFYWKVLG